MYFKHWFQGTKKWWVIGFSHNLRIECASAAVLETSVVSHGVFHNASPDLHHWWVIQNVWWTSGESYISSWRWVENHCTMDARMSALGGHSKFHPTMQVDTSAVRLYICEVCDTSFTRKYTLSRHLAGHGQKELQCSHGFNCYSRGEKLKAHTLPHHTQENLKSPKKSLVCAYCSKMFTRSFNLGRHIAVCMKKSVEPTKPDMEDMILEMTQAERQYRQKLEVGKAVSTLLQANEHLSEESLPNEYKEALKLYRQLQVQHVPLYEHATYSSSG